MALGMKAIEVTGTVDEGQQFHLDEPLPIHGPARVRVIVLLSDEVDIEERDWLRAVATNPAFDFLSDPGEDLYSPADGRPFVKRDPG